MLLLSNPLQNTLYVGPPPPPEQDSGFFSFPDSLSASTTSSSPFENNRVFPVSLLLWLIFLKQNPQAVQLARRAQIYPEVDSASGSQLVGLPWCPVPFGRNYSAVGNWASWHKLRSSNRKALKAAANRALFRQGGHLNRLPGFDFRETVSSLTSLFLLLSGFAIFRLILRRMENNYRKLNVN